MTSQRLDSTDEPNLPQLTPPESPQPARWRQQHPRSPAAFVPMESLGTQENPSSALHRLETAVWVPMENLPPQRSRAPMGSLEPLLAPQKTRSSAAPRGRLSEYAFACALSLQAAHLHLRCFLHPGKTRGGGATDFCSLHLHLRCCFLDECNPDQLPGCPAVMERGAPSCVCVRERRVRRCGRVMRCDPDPQKARNKGLVRYYAGGGTHRNPRLPWL